MRIVNDELNKIEIANKRVIRFIKFTNCIKYGIQDLFLYKILNCEEYTNFWKNKNE